MSEITARLSTALADRYRIERHLGEGGMANVYLAEDLKHHRKVAVKVLRPELAAVLGAERFVQEIETTANLQHPHILPLFDSGEADSFLYYVMPFIDGETVRDKLNRETQFGIDEAVGITADIADALDYANRNNVIHRDIKPENILLHDGRPMVADFGIALAVSAAAGGRMTETGLSLGTPHYMSPEQATAEKDLTNRSDIYSLGCVLYEMLTGEPPHTGASAQAVVMKIVTEDVQPVTELRKSVPTHVAAATAKSLEKLPADRFETAKEFAEALTNPAFTLPTTQAAAVAGAAASGPWNRLSIGLASLAAVLAVVALWGWLRPASESPTHPVRFSITPAAGQAVAITGVVDVAFSPDGSRFVYRGQGEGGFQLLARAVDELEARPIPGTEGAFQPFFSPDGLWLGFFQAGGQLKKVQISGGPPLPIAETGGFTRGATWGSNDVIVFASSGQPGLMQVPGSGGAPQPLTAPDTAAGETDHRWPAFGPEGKTVFFTSWSGSNETARIAVASLESGTVTRLAEAGVGPHYTDTGHLVYTRSDGSVVGVPFDLGRGEVTGQAIALLASVTLSGVGAAELAISRNGSLVYVPGSAALGVNLVLVDRQGLETSLDDRSLPFQAPRFSPSGDRVAMTIEGHVWVYDVEQRTLSVRTFEGGNFYPTWSADGTQLMFSSDRTASRSLYTLPADGSTREPAPLLETQAAIYEGAWSPDGRWLAFREGTGTDRDILVMPLEGEDRTPRPFAQTTFNERALAISPDGRWLAYVSNESGRDEVYVRAFPEPAGQEQVSVNGGQAPRWAPGGDELFYRTASGMTAATVETERAFRVTGRTVLFEDDYRTVNPVYAHYDVDPRSGRFLMLTGEDASGEIIVVANWLEELRRRMGN
jgi:serine/threonine-protein kinase